MTLLTVLPVEDHITQEQHPGVQFEMEVINSIVEVVIGCAEYKNSAGNGETSSQDKNGNYGVPSERNG